MSVLETVKKMKGSMAKSKTSGSQQEVEFALFAPDARTVFLAGSFNNWDTNALPMKKAKNGTWKAKIKLAPGRYEYKYFVDSNWVQEMPGASLVPNCFGTSNCVIGIE
jgi:1,4-alpha-glucan branching enzyme